MRIRLSDLSPEELDRLTDTMTDAEIGRLAGVVRTAATNHRKKWGIRSWAEKHGTRRYKESYTPAPGAKRAFSHRRGCRENCFSVVDTPEKAYWLGLLAADGWIVTLKGKPIGVSIALHLRDIDLLREYAQFVGFKSEPRRVRPGVDLFQVKISSEKLANDLIAQGIVPRKSKVLSLPKLREDLLPHFVRGLFDGDGSACLRGNNSLTAQITTGSQGMAAGVKDLVDQFTPRGCSLGRDRDAFVLRWYADNALALAEYMYAQNPETRPRMERKAKILFGFQG